MASVESPQVVWPGITPEGERMIEQAVAMEWNKAAVKYGAQTVPVPPSLRPPRAPSRYQLHDATYVAELPPISWRVKGVLPQTGIAAMFGPSGSGKSFLGLDLAMSVAKGAHWFGHRTTKCAVLYVCLEGEAGMSVRVNAYRERYGTEGEVLFLTASFNLLACQDVTDLLQAIKEARVRPEVIILDTLNRAAPGLDENSSAEMGNVIEAVKQLQAAIGGLVVVVHHTGKDATRGLRGHSSLIAALDAAIEVKRAGDLRVWEVAKSKDGEDGKGQGFKLDRVHLGEDPDGDAVTSCVIVPALTTQRHSKPLTMSQQQGLDSFRAATMKIGPAAFEVGIHTNAWREEFYRSSTADSAEAKRKAFNRVRHDLVTLGHLTVEFDMYKLPIGFSSNRDTGQDRDIGDACPGSSGTGQDTPL
jgi:hypothetical protein